VGWYSKRGIEKVSRIKRENWEERREVRNERGGINTRGHERVI